VYSVYILRCADDTFYTGIALDITARLTAHNAGKGAKYTRSRRPVALVYREDGYDKSDALKRENKLRKLSRAEKIKLIF